MTPLREKISKIFEKLLNDNNFTDSEKKGKEIETGIYNNTIKYATYKGIIKRWDNSYFKQSYIKKSESVYTNLDPNSYTFQYSVTTFFFSI